MRSHLLLAMIASFAVIVGAQTQEGFISLDCGLPIDESPYNNSFNGLTFTSDSNFIETGKIAKVEKDARRFSRQYLTMRYFPEGKRNCYSLDVKRGTNYDIVVSFVYGNYDGLNLEPNFDIYLGPNKWARIDLEGRLNGTREEIIHKAKSNSLDICLVKIGATVPLISAIEIRPLRNDTYVTQSGSLRLSFREYYSNSDEQIRYADDVYDRVWYPYLDPSYRQITTSLNINNSETYKVPKTVLMSAATPRNASEPLLITWTPRPSNAEVYLYMHFAEIQALKANETREFNVILRGNFNHSGFKIPKYLELSTLYTDTPVQCDSEGCNLQLVKTPNSTLPPLINAMEAYTVIDFPQVGSSLSDVATIKNIKSTYRLSKISWQGDPCLPQDFSWENLRCSYVDVSTPPRIISLNLSESGLTGSIAPIFQNLTQLQELDLSNNSLTGPIPTFLASMKSLSLINLSGNNLNGSVPQALLDRRNEGLVLTLEGNPNLCKFSSCKPKVKKNKLLLPAIASAASLLVLVAVVALVFVFRKKKVPSGKSLAATPSMPAADVGHANQSESSFLSKKIRFSYTEVQEMTNNLERALGEGGFGVVYHGFVNGTQQVAVKLLSQSSSQGYKHFKAEVELLMRVHHINLVSLVGYCDEGEHLALIYEYMPNGDLKQHLSGKRGGCILSWETRLKIAVDAALGLEYLHTGCKPPMVHRDIKTTNILLDQKFQAKLADFGLSRSFPIGNETYVSTVVAGTPGYLDPEYYQTNWLTEKSDIYSFGIVLLEIITNRPIIQQSREKPHLVEWISLEITKGDLRSVMDPNLHENYDIGSVWKAIEIAMSCVSLSSTRRPSMSRVVNELKECIISEKSRIGETRDMESKSSLDFSMDIYTEGIPKAR
ncbi:probable leucine-rich repeat receptor-like protein kinase At2g28990 isoform X1 [Eutrema salsugineum]|uniref:probable leucine-rich repeat receptor-like protein kinase At2g28990 isoform X1 n=1 Tax=Eutrema salsugineum TaxID=72664 RepID=UPI000CED4806|nr:probable leucine-rich repeat receptor-like protein kinase At2g28990 isoform X1 [Eutrema salsugineum]